MFESLVWAQLCALDGARPVYVESESKKIGQRRVPEALIAAMWASECVRVDASMEVRIELLMQEYTHFVAEPSLLAVQLDCLVELYGKKRIDAWKTLAIARDGDTLVRELLETHYDPAYTRSTLKHFPRLTHGTTVEITAASDAAFEQAAARML
jgi:tRNA 2-selenouridine synthase